MKWDEIQRVWGFNNPWIFGKYIIDSQRIKRNKYHIMALYGGKESDWLELSFPKGKLMTMLILQ